MQNAKELDRSPWELSMRWRFGPDASIYCRVGGSVIESLCDGPVKVAVEFLFLLHLITAFPILMNPPNQFFEALFKIPSSK